MLHQDCQSKLLVDLSIQEQDLYSGGGQEGGESEPQGAYPRQEQEGQDGKKWSHGLHFTKSIVFAPIFK